jgi:hypothetical protein
LPKELDNSIVFYPFKGEELKIEFASGKVYINGTLLENDFVL